MRAEAANIYRSNWQPRDASEVTQIRAGKAASQGCVLNTPTHIGPQTGCCPDSLIKGQMHSDTQPGGFSTSWSYDAVRDRKVGGAYCNDAVYGTAGLRQLKTCDEVYAILGRDASGNLLESSKNPVKGATPELLLQHGGCAAWDYWQLPGRSLSAGLYWMAQSSAEVISL